MDPLQVDRELVDRILAGDKTATTTFIRRFTRTIYMEALNVTRNPEIAEDVCQDYIFQALNRLYQWRQVKPLISWIRISARYHALNWMRSQHNKHNKELYTDKSWEDMQDLIVDPAPSIEETMSNSELYTAVIHIVYNLPSQQRKAFILRTFEDMSFAEIAKTMGVAYDTAKSNYRWALLKIREHLKDQGVEHRTSTTTSPVGSAPRL